ncbi:hypothetical protein ACFQS3_02480 [Glycomyces mayteni]|uniref:Uncharacterized protein n=1 Tax=Glycomyces mayteni TaxID=543887 RepID=A0ABW2D1A7_9ACTN|nr:hypothetical protein GCM10025732_47950 [Glycomyces mayteni]
MTKPEFTDEERAEIAAAVSQIKTHVDIRRSDAKPGRDTSELDKRSKTQESILKKLRGEE